MAKEFFKDLPDTSTPINSARLNGLLNGNESMGSIVVEDVKSKNLFNFNNLHMDWATIDYANKRISFKSYNNSTTNTLKDICPDLVVGETYTFSFTTTSEMDFIYLKGSKSNWFNGQSHIITQEELDNEIFFYGATDVEHTMSNIQIEKGSVATEYVPYKNFGGIIESGSNENGYYVKYSDGTLMQRGTVIFEANNPTFYIYFPISFVDSSYQINTSTFFQFSKLAVASYSEKLINRIKMFPNYYDYLTNTWLEGNNFSHDQCWDWIAIGRWK